MKFIGIIPSRYASTRFPGKPLIDIGGKTMVQRVFEQASKAFETVYVATDDDRIEQHIISFGGKVVRTSELHKSGTDRCAEAIEKINSLEKTSFDVIVNIQGDEPFIQPEQLQLVKNCFNEPKTQIGTLVKKINTLADVDNPNVVKVVLNANFGAIYFSRSAIPYIRNFEKDNWLNSHSFYKHIGIYAYRYHVLKEITSLPQSTLEIAESLEQLRWIENNYAIKAAETHFETVAIDTPDDLAKLA